MTDHISKVYLQDVVIEDVADFFVDHAISDNLGIIANSHLAFADQLPAVSSMAIPNSTVDYPEHILRCVPPTSWGHE